MGSITNPQTTKRGGRFGKIDAPLDARLQSVKWGKYKIGDLFESSNGDYDIQKKHINGKGEWVITAGLTNNGVLGRSDVNSKIFNANTITIDMFGSAFYRQFPYKMVTHARVFSLKPRFDITDRQGIFIANTLSYLYHHFGYENMCSWEKIKDRQIELPLNANGEVDFAFMEEFVRELERERLRELEAYLKATGLKDYNITPEEDKVLRLFMRNKVVWKKYTYKDLFNQIKQGRRLKKEDQKKGSVPFVMSGTTNTGVVGYISNPIAIFPSNSITIDIFGNTFYRSYEYGAGDDTGVYWSDSIRYSKEHMLFFTTSIGKALKGQYSYGHKLRSSQSYYLLLNLPVTEHNKLDYTFMETFIRAVQKLVIKDVVLYADRRIAATKEAIIQHL